MITGQFPGIVKLLIGLVRSCSEGVGFTVSNEADRLDDGMVRPAQETRSWKFCYALDWIALPLIPICILLLWRLLLELLCVSKLVLYYLRQRHRWCKQVTMALPRAIRGVLAAIQGSSLYWWRILVGVTLPWLDKPSDLGINSDFTTMQSNPQRGQREWSLQDKTEKVHLYSFPGNPRDGKKIWFYLQ